MAHACATAVTIEKKESFTMSKNPTNTHTPVQKKSCPHCGSDKVIIIPLLRSNREKYICYDCAKTWR